ncbi:endonuclease-reverse transcriptase domain-containing protein [Phthorimaea operculella]|nr:endonuclease-reverse transcriptase domain-containing protein [Phthorimaea operculella]
MYSYIVMVIISADSNAHHIIWGSEKSNARGDELFHYLLTTGLNIINRSSEPTFVTKRAQTIIDLTFATEYISRHILDWHVSKEISCSDHRWIIFTLNIMVSSAEPRRIPRKMDRVRYRTLTAENLKGIAIPRYATTAEIDTHNNQITGTLMNCFEQTCPLVTPRRGTAVRNNWWSPDLEKLRRKLRKLFNRAKNTRAELDWDRYKETQYQYKSRSDSGKPNAGDASAPT